MCEQVLCFLEFGDVEELVYESILVHYILILLWTVIDY